MCARVLIYLKRYTMYKSYIANVRYVLNPAHICRSFRYIFFSLCLPFRRVFFSSTKLHSVVYSLDTCSFCLSHSHVWCLHVSVLRRRGDDDGFARMANPRTTRFFCAFCCLCVQSAIHRPLYIVYSTFCGSAFSTGQPMYVHTLVHICITPYIDTIHKRPTAM